MDISYYSSFGFNTGSAVPLMWPVATAEGGAPVRGPNDLLQLPGISVTLLRKQIKVLPR